MITLCLWVFVSDLQETWARHKSGRPQTLVLISHLRPFLSPLSSSTRPLFLPHTVSLLSCHYLLVTVACYP